MSNPKISRRRRRIREEVGAIEGHVCELAQHVDRLHGLDPTIATQEVLAVILELASRVRRDDGVTLDQVLTDLLHGDTVEAPPDRPERARARRASASAPRTHRRTRR